MLSHFSHVRLFAVLWTVALQAPLSMGFSRQNYWSGVPCLPPGDLPQPWIKPATLLSPSLADGFFTTSATWEAQRLLHHCFIAFLLLVKLSMFSVFNWPFLFLSIACFWPLCFFLEVGGYDIFASYWFIVMIVKEINILSLQFFFESGICLLINKYSLLFLGGRIREHVLKMWRPVF